MGLKVQFATLIPPSADPYRERGREGRLPRLCWDLQDDLNGRGALLGLGLDEDTGLAISNVDEDNAEAEVRGRVHSSKL